MPNLCTGFMNIRGYAPNVDEFIAILQANYSYNKSDEDWTYCADSKNFSHIPHFFRVFQAIPFNEVWHSGIYKCVSIDLEVAWSIYCCMFSGPLTYYNDFQRNHYNQHFASHILAESKRLQLEIEIWSYEPGMGFQEHYKVCSGVLVKNECFNFSGVWLEDYANYEEFKNDEGNKDVPIDEQAFNERIKAEDYWYEYGHHEEEVDFLPEDEPIYLANIIMVKSKGSV